MNYLFYIGLVLLVSCSAKNENPQEHLISNKIIRDQLIDYITYYDTIPSLTGSFLTHMINDDALRLSEDLINHMKDRADQESLMSDKLRDFLNFNNIKGSRNLTNSQVYQFTYSYSLNGVVINVKITKNDLSEHVDMNIKHFRIIQGSNNKFDVDTVYLNRIKKLTTDEWDELNSIVYDAYFWRISNQDKNRDSYLDSWSFSVEGVREYGQKRQFHAATFSKPTGNSVAKLSDFVLNLTGEDFTVYKNF